MGYLKEKKRRNGAVPSQNLRRTAVAKVWEEVWRTFLIVFKWNSFERIILLKLPVRIFYILNLLSVQTLFLSIWHKKTSYTES